MEKVSFIFKKEDFLSRTQGEGTEIRLLAKAEDVEVQKQTILAKRTFWLDSVDEWQGFEFIYLLEGQLSYLDADPPILIEPGDYIARHLVPGRAYFEAKTDAIVLYLSSQPSYQLISQETKEYVQLAREIEKDEYTDGHCNRISHFSRLLGGWMSLPGERLYNLGYAAFFHDIGKAKVPKEILQKPAKLNEQEWEVMKQHTVWGREMLEAKDLLKDAALIVEQTHERIDGKGYPNGLSGDDICLEAKIISVVDAYDAMTTDRPYRKGLPQEEAIRRLQENAGTQFDSKVVQAFIEMLEQEGLKLPEFNQELARLQRHAAFLKIGEEILSDKDIQHILDHVVSAIIENSPFRRAALALYAKPISMDSTEDVGITRIACIGLSQEEETRLKANPLPAHERHKIFDEEFRISRSYYIPHDHLPWLEYPGLIRGQEEVASEDAWHPDDFLCIPMLISEQVIGIISVDEPTEGQVPTPEILEPIEIFANFAALAIERTRHMGELQGFQHRLKSVYKLSEKLAQVETADSLADHVMNILAESFSYEHADVCFKEGKEFVLKGLDSTLPEATIENTQRILLHEGIMGWVATHRRPALVDDVNVDERYIKIHDDVRSELTVPIEDRDEVVGVLNLESVRKGAFTSEDLELLQALARQLGPAINNLRHQQQLQESLREREWANDFLQGLNQVEDFEELLELIIERGIELLAPKANAGSLMFWNDEKDIFEFRAAINRDLETLNELPFVKDRLIQTVWQAYRPQILTRTQQIKQRELSANETATDELPPASTISIPIRNNQQLIALFNVNNLEEEGIFNEEDAQKLWALIPQIELALNRLKDLEKLRLQAIIDPLTQVYNRHYLSEMIEKEQARAKRYDFPISLIMLDFVDFYEINDRFGHLEGDRILFEAATVFKENVRTCDAVIRYGGDEFLIVLPETTRPAAEDACNRLKAGLKNEDWGLPFDVSIQTGIATWEPNSSRSFENVLEEADAWMYHHKRRTKIK